MAKLITTDNLLDFGQQLAAKEDVLLASKVDKVPGKELSSEDFTSALKAKLEGIAEQANKYVHPATHSANMIVQDATHRFATDSEKVAWNAKLDASQKGTANGIASLDANGTVPASQLPSYVDDVLEYANLAAFPAKGETGKIYVALDTNKTYRWSGTAYIVISETIALGETSSTAYAGNKGKANADEIAKIKNGTTKVPKAGNADTVNNLSVLSAVPANAKFTDTLYSNMKGATASAAGGAGLVPAPASGKQTSFLRGDGTWVVPTNTTYGLVTQSANGLMSATDKVKLDGMTYASDADIDSIIAEIFG